MAQDVLKKYIAAYVQAVVSDNSAPRPPEMADVKQIEFVRVDELNMQVRVKRVSGGPRYFNVKVSEVY